MQQISGKIQKNALSAVEYPTEQHETRTEKSKTVYFKHFRRHFREFLCISLLFSVFFIFPGGAFRWKLLTYMQIRRSNSRNRSPKHRIADNYKSAHFAHIQYIPENDPFTSAVLWFNAQYRTLAI